MKNWKEYKLGFRIVFIILWVLELGLMVYTMLHPRFICFFNIVLLLLAILVEKRWMEKGTTADGSQEEKAKVKPVLKVIVSLVILEYLLIMFAAFLNLIFPHHAIYEYEYDIKKLRTSNFYDRNFFPDSIPKDAKKAEWIMLPSFMQGAGTEVLFFTADDAYIEAEVSRVAAGIPATELETGMIFQSYLSDEQEKNLKVYKLYDNGDWNHSHMWGIFVNEEQNLIGYFCQ